MTEVITLENGNQVEVGCWLDGAAGWTNSYRVVDIATHHGMELDAEDKAVVDWYRASGESDSDASDAELTKLHGALGGDGWVELDAEDGSVRLRLEHVLWVRVDKDEQRVGFGLGGG